MNHAPTQEIGAMIRRNHSRIRRTRAETNPDAEELRWSDEELLESLGCTRRINGQFSPTVAGMMLFGKPQALMMR